MNDNKCIAHCHLLLLQQTTKKKKNKQWQQWVSCSLSAPSSNNKKEKKRIRRWWPQKKKKNDNNKLEFCCHHLCTNKKKEKHMYLNLVMETCRWSELGNGHTSHLQLRWWQTILHWKTTLAMQEGNKEEGHWVNKVG